MANEYEYYELRMWNDMTQAKVRRPDLVEPELSYSIVGVCFRVANELSS